MIDLVKTEKNSINPKTWVALITLLVLLVLPLFTDAYTLTSYRDVLLLGLFALSLDIFWGRSGILSFGHATFFGLGAYGMAMVSVHFSIPEGWVSIAGIVFGMSLAAVVAALVGYFMFYGGVRGAYFTIVTLALTLIAQHIAIGWSSVTGGDAGLIGIASLNFFGLTFSQPHSSYYFAVVILAISVGVALRVFSGPVGTILQAIQDSELKMKTLGYNTQLILLKTFVTSAAVAGLAGALYAAGTGFVAPDMIALLLSTEVIIWVTLGGTGSLIGPVIGTMVVWKLQQEVSSINASAWPIAIGTFFILLALVFPNGLPAYAVEKFKKYTHKKSEKNVQ